MLLGKTTVGLGSALTALAHTYGVARSADWSNTWPLSRTAVSRGTTLTTPLASKGQIASYEEYH